MGVKYTCDMCGKDINDPPSLIWLVSQRVSLSHNGYGEADYDSKRLVCDKCLETIQNSYRKLVNL